VKLSLQKAFLLLKSSALYQKTSANTMQHESGGVLREPRKIVGVKSEGIDFNAESRCALDEMHLRRSRQVTRGHRPSPVGGASGCVVGLSERSEPEGPQGTARRKVTQRKCEVM
jgi:hypothetical protein